MNIDNQQEYWDKVAGSKTFTHPLDYHLIRRHFQKDDNILDYGCGYGRIVNQLIYLGHINVVGYDTSKQEIDYGLREDDLPLFHIDSPRDLPVPDNSIDHIILFAVLTCIPSNEAQKALIHLLHSKLKPGGTLYISDYYLQEHSVEVSRYGFLNNNPDNYGVFSLEEGVTFRHHTREWISELLNEFTLLTENPVEVQTMNGNKAKAFQIIARKQ